jgi:glucose-6-phosphate isomerase
MAANLLSLITPTAESSPVEKSLPYRHLTETCFGARIAGAGLGKDAFAQALNEAGAVLDELRARPKSGDYALLRLPHRDDDLAALEAIADDYRARFDNVVVLGAGGSSLGGQTLCSLAGNTSPQLHFVDNIDPDSFAGLLDGLDPAATGFITISKSGATAETLAQTLICIDWLGEDRAASQMTAIVEPGNSPLRRLAERLAIAILDHDPGIAGRYSVLSLVGLLPALIAGLDVRALRRGAALTLDAAFNARNPSACPPAVGAAIAVGLLREQNISQTVLMPYADRLAPFGRWFRQLWAESLGKDGTGTTPIDALGATDQHSQLQLWLGGPHDKMFTLIMLDRHGAGPMVPPSDDQDLAYLEGRTLGDLMAAEQRATAETLAGYGRPVRLVHLKTLDEHSLGALLMHFMLETIITAGLIDVEPFGQPAVDDGKALARAYLAGESHQ